MRRQKPQTLTPATETSRGKGRWIWRGVLGLALAFTAALWLLPQDGGTACSEIDQCVSTVRLDLGQLRDQTDDWQVEPRGLTLSPDESEAAVVLWSPALEQRRLVTFDTLTGAQLVELTTENADIIWNPAYSNDGSFLAATTGVGLVDQAAASGRVRVWDRATGDIYLDLHEWSWDPERDGEFQDWLYDDVNQVDLVPEYYEWGDCRTALGFSNDGVYLYCDGGSGAIALENSDRVSAIVYEPGFNTLPSGTHTAHGRVIYDPNLTGTSNLRVEGDSALLTRPSERWLVGSLDQPRIDLDPGSWEMPSTAITGDHRFGAVTRAAAPGRLQSLVPRRFRSAGELNLINMVDASAWRVELNEAPTTGRFSLTGETYALVTQDLSLMLFDVNQDD